MAMVHVVLCNVRNRDKTGSTMPVPESQPIASETVASSATSQKLSINGGSVPAATPSETYWSVTTKGDIWVNFGANPVAGSGAGWLLLAGQSREWSVKQSGEKIAIKDA